MDFSFSIPRPQELEKILKQRRDKLLKTGGMFIYEETGGSFSSAGLSAVFEIKDDEILFIITKKPLVFHNELVVKKITEMFS